jgi:CRP-like cAMP-binding protein
MGAIVDVLSLFKPESEKQSHTAGAILFRKGDEARAMFVVLEGEVDIVLDGRVLSTEGAGSLFGEMALIGDHRRSADAIAKSDCVLACIDERRFAFLVGETPYFALHVMRLLVERIRRKEQAA